MNPVISDYLQHMRLGTAQTFKNMSVLPLFPSTNSSPEYVTLHEGLEANVVTITEVDQSGSVPELKVINTSEGFVLLLDGEELMGAKQNRVLNTSILLRNKSETIIPVSCTEAGRWSHSSRVFGKSGNFASPRTVRTTTLGSVSASLRRGRGYSSDQGRVWENIESMHLAAGTSSRTSAMRDSYRARAKDLEAYSQAFGIVPEQQGSLVLINGDVVGFDVVSRQEAYQAIHTQLISSYAMDALLDTEEPTEVKPDDAAARFIEEAVRCSDTRYDSVGQGYDHRFEGKHMLGSALLYEEAVIHAAFFGMPRAQEQLAG